MKPSLQLRLPALNGSHSAFNERTKSQVFKKPAALQVLSSTLLFLCLSIFSSQIQAQTNTWNGGGTNNWTLAGNWSLGHVPLLGEDVVIPNNRTLNINTNAVCNSFVIAGGGSDNTVTITGTNSLTVTGAVTIGAGTGTGDDKILSVGTGALTAASIAMAETGSSTRRCEVNLSTGVINVSGNITMDGSSARNFFRFTAAGTLNLGGNFTGVSGGILIPSTGTVNCNGSLTQTLSGLNTTSFYNLSINKTAVTDQVISSGTAFSVANNLSVTTGILQLQVTTADYTVNNISIATGGTLDAGTTSVLNVAGNWANSGSFVAGSGTVEFNGAAARVISGTTVTGFNNLAINNPGGITLSTVDASVSGGTNSLYFLNGKIVTGSYKVVMGASATITGANATRYINGNLQMAVATGSPTRVFEIGDAAIYAPVSVVFNGVTVMGNVTAYTTAGDHAALTSSLIDETKSVNRHWRMVNSGTSLTSYTPTFNFQPSEIDGGSNTANFIIGRRSGSWAYPTMITANPTNCSATLSSFGEYAIGEGGAGVPVIASQPVDNVVCSGTSANFVASATNKPSSSAQWFISTDGGGSYSVLSIAAPYSVVTSTVGSVTTSTLTINPVAMSMDGYQYKVTFTNSRGSVTSADPYIAVTASPTANAGAALSPLCGAAISAPLGGTVGGTATGGTWSTISGGTFSPAATDLNATWTPPVGFTGTATLTLTTSGGGCGIASDSKTQVVSAATPVPGITPASASICNNAIQVLTAVNASTLNGSSGTVNIAIPNNSATGMTNAIALAIPAGATITAVNVTFNVTHAEVADLIVNLRAPNGNIINLANRPAGGAGTNFTNTIVSSGGSTALSAGTSPFTGTFRADAVNGIGATGQVSNTTNFSSLFSSTSGNWVLSARDAAFANSGTLVSWSITVTYSDPITWTPIAGLYTDAGATVAYAGQNRSTVYAKPTTPGAHVYTAVATSASGCSNSQTVTVNAGPVVTVTTDYCYGGGKIQLTAVSNPAASSWLWNTGATTQSILVDLAGLYQVTATTGGGCIGNAAASIAQELVVNGDFTSGNTGFTSSYSYVNPGVANGMYPEATYTINNNPTFNHNMFFGRDHTSNTGNLMIINGAGSAVTVWQQSFTVQPNTTYYFSAWAISLNNAAPFAQLQFDVNGSAVGTTAVLAAGPSNNNPPYNWVRFYGNWTSGPTVNSAVVSIKDLQTALGGNDFGLDDISFGTLSTFISHTSPAGSDSQTVCKNTAIVTNTYNVGGGVAGPIVTGLPAGVSSYFNGISLIISGTPTTVGTHNYSITTTGTCSPVTAYGQIIVREDSLARTSAAGTDAQTPCLNNPITPVTYAVGGAATGASVTGLPAGVTGAYSGGVFTISGSPTAAGTFTYTITTTGGCAPLTANGSFLVRRQIITRSSPAGTNTQTLCINTPIANITYSVGGTSTGASVSGLPAGVSGSFSAGVFTISGTPTIGGVYNYTVTTSGTCNPVTATGTLTVTQQTITLSSAPGTNVQAACLNAAITDINYTLTGATAANVTGLPAGLSGTFTAGSFTINGIPTVTGVFNYTVTTVGSCAPAASAGGTITISQQLVNLSSPVGTNMQTLCINTALTSITYAVAGTATGASVSGLPAGVTGNYASGTITISGTPTAGGAFNYTVTTTGTCTPAATATGTITVTQQTITLSSGAGTNNQTRCRNVAISNITFNIGGSGTGAGVTGLPPGVTGSYSAGVFTISGTPTVAAVYNYTVTTTGTCSPATATGTITVNRQTISLSSAAATTAQTLCVGSPITPIIYTVGGSATGAGVVGLPAGVSGSYNAGVYTISGMPTVPGSFNYTVTTTGTCGAATSAGTIIVSPAAGGGTIADQSVCFAGSGNFSLTGYTGTIVRWETSADGITWTNIANTTNTQSFTAVTQGARYRALVQSGACAATMYSNIAKLGIHNLWTGETNSDWNTNSNWSDGLAPTTSCPDVTIPVLTAPNVYPQLTSGTASINNLVIHPNATMLISNAILQVAGSISNAGVLDVTAGTLELNGSAAAQNIAGSFFANHAIRNLVISNSNGVNFVNTNDTVKITGLLSFGASNAVLNTNNNLTLVSDINGTASVGDLTNGGTLTGTNILGNATVERYIPLHPKSWQFLATPTRGQSINASWQEGNTPLANSRPGYGTIITGHMAGAVALGFDLATPTGPSMKTYNAVTNGWEGVANPAMQVANPKGYMMLVRGDRSVFAFNQAATTTTLRTTGKLYTFGADAPVSSTVLPGKLESIGNPYASAIDFRLLAKPAAPDVDDAFYVWDPLLTNNYNGLGGYQTISAANAWKPIPGGTSNYDANTAYPFIQSGQAFLVHATGAGGTVSFAEANKVAVTATVNRQEDPGGRQFLRMSLFNASSMLSDGNVVAFDAQFNNSYTADDALKVMNAGENIAISSNGKLLSLEARAPVQSSDTIYYSFNNIRRANYRMRFAPDNMSANLTAILVDKFLNTITPLSLNDTTSYGFEITASAGSWAADRFYVVFKQCTPPEIIHFTAAGLTGRVAMNWTVTHELDVRQYSVERGTDGTNFQTVLVVDPMGNNDNTVSYQAADNSPLATTAFYRIKGIKLNGSTFTSPVIRIIPSRLAASKNSSVAATNEAASAPGISVYPNPVVGKLVNVKFVNPPKGRFNLELVGAEGKTVHKSVVLIEGNSQSEIISLNKAVPTGSYQLKVTAPGKKTSTIHLLIN